MVWGFFIVYAIALLFSISPIASAQTTVDSVLIQIINTLDLVVLIVFILAVIAFGWGIVKLIAAAGNPTEIKNSKQIIVWSVIAIAILASIAGIIAYLQDFFYLPSTGSITIPKFPF